MKLCLKRGKKEGKGRGKGHCEKNLSSVIPVMKERKEVTGAHQVRAFFTLKIEFFFLHYL